MSIHGPTRPDTERGRNRGCKGRGTPTCDKHVPIKPNAGEGPSKIMHRSEHEKAHEGTYSPWIVVAQRRNVTKTEEWRGLYCAR